MAPIADPILVGPSDYTDQVLRWAESMPGMTYKTRIVKKAFTLTDLAKMRKEGGTPSLYSLEAYDADFTAFYENLQRNSDGTLKRVGRDDSSGWGDPFMYDAHKHAGIKEKDESWVDAILKRNASDPETYKRAAEDTLDKHHMKRLITPPETVEPLDPCAQNTKKPEYEPMKSGVWVDTGVNEDDVTSSKNVLADEDRQDLAQISVSDKLDPILDQLRELILGLAKPKD